MLHTTKQNEIRTKKKLGQQNTNTVIKHDNTKYSDQDYY